MDGDIKERENKGGGGGGRQYDRGVRKGEGWGQRGQIES